MWAKSMPLKLHAVAGAATLLAVSVAAQGAGALTINTPPSLISCQPASITWSGAQPPVYLSVLKGGDLASAPLRQFPEQQAASGSYPWTVDLGSGTSVTLQIRDGTGQTQASAPVNVLAGPDNKQCTGNGNNTQPAGGSGGSSAGSSSSAPASSPMPASGSSSTSSAPAKNSSSPSAAAPSSPAPASTGMSSNNTSSSTPASATKKNGATSVYQPTTAVLVLCLSAVAILVGQSGL